MRNRTLAIAVFATLLRCNCLDPVPMPGEEGGGGSVGNFDAGQTGGGSGGGDSQTGGGIGTAGGAQTGGGTGGGAVPSCLTTFCDGGCCDATTGACREATVSVCPESSGVCLDCSDAPEGHGCIVAAFSYFPSSCGCNTQKDCPLNFACDMIAHSCTTQCGVVGITTICNGGCCASLGGGTFSCIAGDQPAGCGSSGGLCSTCSSSVGPECIDGHCGCSDSSMCPQGKTCANNHTCE